MLRARKVLALVLTAAMSVSMLAACGEDSGSVAAGKDATPSQVQESSDSEAAAESASEAGDQEAYVPTYPIVDEPITVTAVVVGQDMTNERIFWQQLAELTNINVEFINVEPEQLNVFLAGNEWPDFFLSGLDSSILYEYGALGNKLVDYKEYRDIMPNLWSIFEDYPLAEKCSTQTNGAIYALPRIEETSTNTLARVHYRADFLEENGLEVPSTPEEFYEVLVKCRDLNNGEAPLVQNVSGRDYTTSIVYPAFGEHALPGLYDDGTGTVYDDRVEQQYRDFLIYMNKLYEEGLLHQEYLTLDTNSMLSLVQAGTAVFFSECSASVTADMFSDGQLHIGVMKPLVAKEGDPIQCVARSSVIADNNFAINADSPYVEEICKMIDIAFATEEVQEGSGIYGLAFNYGQVGMCIHLNDDGTYDLTMPDGSDGFNSEWLYDNVVYGYAGVLQLGQYITSTPGNSQERQKGYVENILPYATMEDFPSAYFTYTEEEQAVLDQYTTEFTSYVDEMRNKFIMGVEDIGDDATWEKYCSQMEAYGMNELIAAYQSAYDRFMSN